MIVCITPNVAVDRSYLVPTVKLGTVLRSKHTVVTAGGKGLNVARAVSLLGSGALAMGILGGHSGEVIAELMAKETLFTKWTWVKSETRNCAILLSEDGTPATVINDRGGTITMLEWLKFIQDIVGTLTDRPTTVRPIADPLSPLAIVDEDVSVTERKPQPTDRSRTDQISAACLCGSLPPGPPSNAPADLIDAIRSTGTPVWLDASGQALRNALEASPTGIKINSEEASALVGRDLRYVDDIYAAAHELRGYGVETVIITMGARGAILVSQSQEMHLRAPALKAISNLGSGDAFLAGFLVARERGYDDQKALAWAVAAGAANTLVPGGGLFARADFDDILGQLI